VEVELTAAMRAFLDEPRFAVIGTINPDRSPQLTVMWYERRGDRIVLNTKAGRAKDRNLRRDPRLSFIVEDAYRFFRAAGTVERNEDQSVTQEDIRRLAVRYHGRERGDALARRQFSKEERITYVLTLKNLYAGGFS
jgi:PPOX class probable F420-dependent enzyme